MQALVFILLFLIVTACGTFSTEEKEKALVYLQVGTSQLQNGNYPQAMSSLLQAEKLDPDNPSIQNNLGLAYYVRDYFPQAEKAFRKAIHLKPDYTDAKNNLGRSLIELNRYQEAIQVLQIAEKDLTYGFPEKPLINLGLAYFKMEKFDLAKNYFAKALNVQKENCFAFNYYGRSLYELKKFSEASNALDRAVGFCQINQFDEPHYYSALAYYQSGNHAKAEARLEELLKLYPQGKYQERARIMLETFRR